MIDHCQPSSLTSNGSSDDSTTYLVSVTVVLAVIRVVTKVTAGSTSTLTHLSHELLKVHYQREGKVRNTFSRLCITGLRTTYCHQLHRHRLPYFPSSWRLFHVTLSVKNLKEFPINLKDKRTHGHPFLGPFRWGASHRPFRPFRAYLPYLPCRAYHPCRQGAYLPYHQTRTLKITAKDQHSEFFV